VASRTLYRAVIGSVGSTRADVVVTRTLGVWRDSWDALVECAPVPSPFLRSWWLEGVGGANVRFVLVVDDGLLIGGLALERRRCMGLSQYRFASSGVLCPDHLDLLTALAKESAAGTPREMSVAETKASETFEAALELACRKAGIGSLKEFERLLDADRSDRRIGRAGNGR